MKHLEVYTFIRKHASAWMKASAVILLLMIAVTSSVTVEIRLTDKQLDFRFEARP